MQFKIYGVCFALLSVLIQGCPSSGVTALGGVAAVGAPLSDATVTLVDANGTTLEVTADAEGAYTFDDVGTMTAPFLLKATGVVGGEEQTMYSALDEKPTPGETAVLNATPMTNAVVAQASGGDPAALFANPKGLDATAMKDAKEKILVVLADQMKEQGLDPTKFDPFKTPFRANSSGFDKMLDLVKIQADPSGQMKLTDKATGVETAIKKDDALSAMANKVMPKPDAALLTMDFSKVKNLVAGMNAVFKKTDRIATDFDPYIDSAGFINNGKDHVEFKKMLVSEESVGMQLTGFVFGPCDPKALECEGTIGFVQNGRVQQESMAVKYDSANARWKFLGNRRDVEFYFGQHLFIEQTYTLGSTTIPDPVVRNGFVLKGNNDSFDKVELFSGTVIKDVTNYGSTPIATWAVNLKDCPEFVYQLDDKTKAICSSFVEFSQLGVDLSKPDDPTMVNFKKGTLRFKLTFSNSQNSKIVPKDVEIRPAIEAITQNDATAYKTVLTNAFTSAVTKGFGTSEPFVMPKGLNVDSLKIWLYSAKISDNEVGMNTVSGFEINSREFDFSKFGDSISIAELCKVYEDKIKSKACRGNEIIGAIYWTFKTPLSLNTRVTFGLKFASS